jgi:hypothetical protein
MPTPSSPSQATHASDTPEQDEAAVAQEFENYLTTIASSFAARLDEAVKSREQEFTSRVEGVIAELRRTRKWVVLLASIQLLAVGGIGMFVWWRFGAIRP